MSQAEADVEELDQALDRLRHGTYGLCAGCDAPIPDERLAAQPTAVTCLTCAQATNAAISSRVRRTPKSGRPGSIVRRPSARGPTS